jgi:hypothetical protein
VLWAVAGMGVVLSGQTYLSLLRLSIRWPYDVTVSRVIQGQVIPLKRSSSCRVVGRSYFAGSGGAVSSVSSKSPPCLGLDLACKGDFFAPFF